MSKAADRMYRALELITASQDDPNEPGATLVEDEASPQDVLDVAVGAIDLFNLTLLRLREATGRPIPELLQELGRTVATGEARGII